MQLQQKKEKFAEDQKWKLPFLESYITRGIDISELREEDIADDPMLRGALQDVDDVELEESDFTEEDYDHPWNVDVGESMEEGAEDEWAEDDEEGSDDDKGKDQEEIGALMSEFESMSLGTKRKAESEMWGSAKKLKRS